MKTKRWGHLFAVRCPVIAMIHLPALPGTPAHHLAPEQILEAALRDAELYLRHDVDGLLIENMHDTPYVREQVGPEVTALMAIIGRELRRLTNRPCGVQVLAGANQQALAIAHAASLDFIRAEAFSFAHVADEGLLESCAASLLRYRKAIGAERVAVLCDIKKKHSSHAITADVDLAETARAAAFMRADGLIVTGTATGQAASLDDLKAAREACSKPVLVGSGVTLDNLQNSLQLADGLIVGSTFKREGRWDQELDEARVAAFMNAVDNWRTEP